MEELRHQELESDDVTEHKKDSYEENKDKRSGKKKRWKISLLLSFCIVGLLVFCVWLALDALTIGTKAMTSSYSLQKNQTQDDTYHLFYKAAFETAEKNHHVKNDVVISVAALQEEQKLEVLDISHIVYEVSEQESNGWKFWEKGESWLEIPGKGVFTVDLRAAEFVVDNMHDYVLVRVPQPALTRVAIETDKIEILHFEGGSFSGSAKAGTEEAQKVLKNAEQTMLKEIKEDQDNFLTAKESAQKILENLVKQLNPDILDLKVEVEFVK